MCPHWKVIVMDKDSWNKHWFLSYVAVTNDPEISVVYINKGQLLTYITHQLLITWSCAPCVFFMWKSSLKDYPHVAEGGKKHGRMKQSVYFYFLFNLLGWCFLTKFYRFQVYSSKIHHLYIILCVHQPKLYLLPSLFITPLPSSTSPYPLSLW